MVTTDIWRNYYTTEKDRKCETDGNNIPQQDKIKVV